MPSACGWESLRRNRIRSLQDPSGPLDASLSFHHFPGVTRELLPVPVGSLPVGRPPNPVGTHGRIRTYPHDGGWRARTTIRDPDGRTREIERWRKSEAAATRAVKEAVRDRSVNRGGELSPDDRVKVAAARWLAEPATQGLAPRTLEQYERVLTLHITPGVGDLRIRDLTVGACATFLRAVEKARGAPTARMCRSVLSGVAGWCAVRDLIDRNPVRDSGKITTRPKKEPRSLTLEAARDLLMWAGYDDRSIRRDVVDFLAWMLATGLRIGEAAAVRPQDVDLEARIVWVTGNLVRLKGGGVVRQETESSKLNPRGLELPVWAVEMLRDRQAIRPVKDGEPLFPAPLGGWRDPSNTQADLRDLRTFAGYEWVTSHTARKTVASLMDEAGLSARAGADQLGHRNPSMTQDRYWGRRVASTGAAAVLERLTQP